MTHKAPFDRLSQLQRALGLAPLALFAGFHLWLHWPAMAGREAWLARVERFGPHLSLGVAILALLLVHAGLGIARIRYARTAQTHTPPDRFQLATGSVLAFFVLYHLTHVWPPADGVSSTLTASYQHLWSQLGRPVVLGSYVIGCGALAAHLGHGVSGALTRRVPSRLQPVVRYCVGGASFVLFVSYLQLISRFATGEPMLPQLF